MKVYFGSALWLQMAAFQLRQEVFVHEQGIPADLEFDALDTPQQDYFLIMANQVPVAAMRYQKDTPQQLHPDRFCVKKAVRDRGIGQLLLHAAEQKAYIEGCRLSCLSAEIAACGFYEKQGYHVVSSPYTEDGIVCVSMRKKIHAAAACFCPERLL